MAGFWIMLIFILCYLGFDYGRLLVKNKALKDQLIESIDPSAVYPTRYILVKSREGSYMDDLAQSIEKGHKKANIKQKTIVSENGLNKIVFENDDELLLYTIGEAPIVALTPYELDNYTQNLLFDYKLPQGAERAIIQQLRLTDYMINIGICTEKSGGK